MKLKRKIIVLLLVILYVLVLASCAAPPDTTDVNDNVTSDPKPAESADPIDVYNSAPVGTMKNAVDEQNTKIIGASANKHTVEIIENTDGKKLIIDAYAELGEIETVSIYDYILVAITDDLRNNLFAAYFGDRAQNAKYDERNDLWTLANSSAIGDYYLYDTIYPHVGEQIPGEESFYIEYRKPNLNPFEDNLLDSVSDSSVRISADAAVKMCDQVMQRIVELSDYKVDYIHAYGTNGRHPFYKIVYKRVLDGMPVTGYNDIYFLIDSDGIQKIFGSLFNTEKNQLQKQIISLDTAITSLHDNAMLIDFYEHSTISIGKITLEYIVKKTLTDEASIIPAWRFWLGTDEDQINLNRSKIIAIDATTGELIQGERGNAF